MNQEQQQDLEKINNKKEKYMVSLRKKKKDDIIALKRLRINMSNVDLPSN